MNKRPNHQKLCPSTAYKPQERATQTQAIFSAEDPDNPNNRNNEFPGTNSPAKRNSVLAHKVAGIKWKPFQQSSRLTKPQSKSFFCTNPA